jgi:hypothetical protein
MRAIVLCLALGLALAGCGAGQESQTASQLGPGNGAVGDAGHTIALRDVWIPYPADHRDYPSGANVPVVATIVNHGQDVDELLAVSSPAASQALVDGAVRLPPGRNVTSAADPMELRSPLVAGALRITLTTNRALRVGLDTPVTFRFSKAGAVTLQVPMVAPPQD